MNQPEEALNVNVEAPSPALEADAAEVPPEALVAGAGVGPADEDFPPEVIAKIKESAIKALEEALEAAKRFEMPLIAVVVMDNRKQQTAPAAAFAAINCPVHIADAILHSGMGALAESLEARADGTPEH